MDHAVKDLLRARRMRASHIAIWVWQDRKPPAQFTRSAFPALPFRKSQVAGAGG